MAELLMDVITSLDGFGAAEGWPGYWGMDVPEYTAWLEASPERDHTILMGATTYRRMSAFASGALDTGMAENDALAELTAARKVVFSSTLDAATAMRTLGSLALCRALLTAGLVERFQLLEYTPTVLAGPPSGAGAA